MRNKIACCILQTLVQLTLALSLQAQQLKLGELELIYTEDEIPIRYDGSLSTLQKDGEMHFFHSFGCRLEPGNQRRSRHSWHKGPPEDPLKVHVSSKREEEFWNYNGYYQDLSEQGIWILWDKWNIPGLSSQSGEDLIPHITGGEDLHADAAYCTALGKYLLTVQTHGAGRLLLFSSPNALDWSLETTVDQAPRGVIQPYSAFVDFDGPTADCHTVDGDFYIYFPRKGPGQEHDTMYRCPITID